MSGNKNNKIRLVCALLIVAALLVAMLLTACDLDSNTDGSTASDELTETSITDSPIMTSSDTTETDSSETSMADTSQPETTPDSGEETNDDTEPFPVWPADEFNGLAAPPGYIAAVIFDDQSKSITVIVDQVLLEEVKDYHLLLQEAHFQLQEESEDALHLSTSLLADPFQMQLLYDKEQQQLMLIYSNLSGSEDTDSTRPHTDEPDILVWPEDWTELMIPAGAVVEDVIVYDERDTLVYLGSISRDKADAYVEVLAELFAQESVVQLGDSSIMYMGENEAGDYVEFFWADDATASIEIIRSGDRLQREKLKQMKQVCQKDLSEINEAGYL